MTQGIINNIRLLMADDDADDLELMESAFREVGFKSPIKTFIDGGAMLDYLLSEEGKSASLVILDLNMPKMNGHEVLDEIRNQNNMRDVPIVLLTASECCDDVEKAHNLGINYYLRKPLQGRGLGELLSAVQSLWH